MIFTRTKRTAQKVADELAERGFAVGAVHGDLGQGAREQALQRLPHRQVDVLVATDVAARGIDVDDVTHVINYQCPEDEQAYVHRIGRTGRAGKTGCRGHAGGLGRAPALDDDRQGLGLGCPDPAETYSNSPHLYLELDIPTETQGTIGAAAQIAGQTHHVGSAQRRPIRATAQRQPAAAAHPRRQNGDGPPRRRRNGKPETEASTPSPGTANETSGDGARTRRRRRRPRNSAGVAANAN